MNFEISISGRRIGASHPPYIVAEMSANHNGSIDNAYAIIDSVAAAGADAIKLQTYRPETITLDSYDEAFIVRGGQWDGRRLYDLYAEAHTPWEWHSRLFARARSRGLTIFSSPFDATAVDLLEDLGAPAYKVASFEAIDLPLIRYVASTKKPMIISTGLANADEIAEAVATARNGGCSQLALLQCVSGYPAPASDYNLRTMTDMAIRFGTVVGLSDHTIDNTTAIASVALGAAIIEKHVTLDRLGGGADDSFSLEPADFKKLCQASRTAWEALGRIDYGLKSSERGNSKFRRSLYFVQDMQKGDIITPDHIRSVRPGYGLAPRFFSEVVGKCVKTDIKKNSPIKLDDLE